MVIILVNLDFDYFNTKVIEVTIMLFIIKMNFNLTFSGPNAHLKKYFISKTVLALFPFQ